jgi:hypothetical protein
MYQRITKMIALSIQPQSRAPLVARARGESGSVLILTALSMVTLVAIAAFGLSAAYGYDRRNALGAAADAAAKSAATELLRTSSLTTAQLQNFANQQVSAHGFTPTATACDTPTTSTVSVCVYAPPIDGAYSGVTGYVEVTAQEQTTVFFGLLSAGSLSPLNRAVAGSQNPSNCLIAFGGDLSLGNTELDMSGCGVGVAGNIDPYNPNSAIYYSPGVPTPEPPVAVAGTCVGTVSACPQMGTDTTGAPSPTDPLSSLPDYTSPTGVNCPGGAAGTTATLNPGCYTSIAQSVTTLNTGNYYITGVVDVNNLTGSGVMLYLANGGQIASKNNNVLTLSAPTTGTYTGIAIFAARTNPLSFDVKNHFTMNITGAIYMPDTPAFIDNHVDITNTGCTLFVAKSININNGSGAFTKNNCAADFGGAAFLSVSLAE